MTTNRQKNLKCEYEDEYDDYDEDQIDEYEEDLDIQDILEETQMDLEIEYVRKLLRKNKGNIDQTIDYLLDNQQRILQQLQQKQNKDKQKQPQKIQNQTIQNNQKKNQRKQSKELELEQENPVRKCSRKLSKEVLDLLESENQPKQQQTQNQYLKNRPVEQYNQNYQANQDYYNKYQQDLKQEEQQDSRVKTVNLVIAGHVDSGKSTLIGNLLYNMKNIEEKQMRKIEKNAKEINKESFKYAWLTDSSTLEREKGVTIDVGYRQILLDCGKQQLLVNIMDTPGHRDFVPNMINGASQADMAIIVIDSIMNAFEAGFERGGQTREHILLVKALGINHVIFGINKQDHTQWDQHRYEHIKTSIQHFLDSQNLSFQQNYYLPISGRFNQNLVEKYKKQDWFDGKCLVEMIKQVGIKISNQKINKENIEKPLRVSIQNIYNSNGRILKGQCIGGKVETGMLSKQQQYVIMPMGITCTIKDIVVNDLGGNAVGKKRQNAFASELVDCALIFNKNYEFSQIKNGSVLSELNYIVPISNRFLCEIYTYELNYPILKGASVFVHTGQTKVSAIIKKLDKVIDRSSGILIKKNPKCVKSHECCELEIQTEQMITVENYAKIAAFGRIALREKQDTIAVGMVKLIK